MHSLPLKRPSSSVTTLFTWRWLKQTSAPNPAHLAACEPVCVCCPTLCDALCSSQDWTNYRRTCKFTQDLAAFHCPVHTHTHRRTYTMTCTRVVAKYFQLGGSEVEARGRQRKYAFKWPEKSPPPGLAQNVTKCCQTFARTLAWQRQYANVHTTLCTCVCVRVSGGGLCKLEQRKIKVLNSI